MLGESFKTIWSSSFVFTIIILFKLYYFFTLYISFYIPQNKLILAEVLEFLHVIEDIIL